MPYGRRKNADVVAMVQEGVVLDQPRYCPPNVYEVRAYKKYQRPQRVFGEILLNIRRDIN